MLVGSVAFMQGFHVRRLVGYFFFQRVISESEQSQKKKGREKAGESID
jgi:hypothetical protein